MRNFADRLLDGIDELDNPSCGGLDTVVDEIPEFIKRQAMKVLGVSQGDSSEAAWAATAHAIEMFNIRLIDATCDIFPAYKAQLGYYEMYKAYGIRAFENTLRHVMRKGRIAIADGKRNDIDRSAEAYARAHLGTVPLVTGATVTAFDEDALTVNPYLGSDGIKPFLEMCRRYGKGIFLLAATSNPSRIELQNLLLDKKHGGRKVYEQVALMAEVLGRDLLGKRGFSSHGIVVGAAGATPEEVRRMAEEITYINPKAVKLIPAYGTQGGTGRDVVPAFDEEGYGGIVNNSSAFALAYQREPYRSKFPPEEFAEAARQAAIDMRDDIRTALKNAGRGRWK